MSAGAIAKHRERPIAAADPGANRLRFRGITPAPTRLHQGGGSTLPSALRGSTETVPQAVLVGNGGSQESHSIDVAAGHDEGHPLEHRHIVERARIDSDHIRRFA